MERPRGLEPPPTAWQAVVLPLYYGRSRLTLLITRGGSGHKACIVGPGLEPPPPRLTDLNDARRLDDRRFLLPFGKFRGLGAVGVNPAKLLAVVIIDGDLPVPMFAPLVLTELGSSSFSHEYRQQSRRTMPI